MATKNGTNQRRRENAKIFKAKSLTTNTSNKEIFNSKRMKFNEEMEKVKVKEILIDRKREREC